MNQNDRSGARDVSVGDRQQPSRPPRGVNPSRSDPWPVDDPAQAPGDCGCGCAKAPRPPATPCNHPIVKPKGDDCCRQILDALKSMPGFDERRLKLHKPKQSTKVKLANRCCLLPVKDCLAPMLMLGLRRFRDGVVPANTFEAKTQGVLQAMSQQRRDALLKALNAYDATPAGRKDCAVDIRFDDWPSDQALDPEFFARNLVAEILAAGRMLRFGTIDPPPPTGLQRLWEQSIPLPGEPGKYAKVTAPWPWICAVGPNATKATDLVTDWFRNESSCVPGNVPRGTTNYHAHEFAWNCAATAGAGSGSSAAGSVTCVHQEPTGASSGFSFAECSGGPDYRLFDKSVGKQVCLTIPSVEPGAEVGLRGLNFLSRAATVRIRKVDQPPFPDIPDIPLSDWFPDTSAPPGTADCSVKDHAFFVMPDHIQDPVNKLNDLLIPPGRYTLQLIVPNETNFAPQGGVPAPASFASNELLFDLQPSAKQRYQVLTDEAFCVEETDGLGSDEPWFRAFTATVDLPKSETKFRFPLLTQVEIMSTDDVDSGEWITFPGSTLFNDALAQKVFAAAVLGLEVDSESAARKEIDDFWGGYQDYMEQWFTQLGSSIDGGVFGKEMAAAFKSGTLSTIGWVSGAVLVAMGAVGILWAVWASADPIAMDVFTLTNRKLAELTDTNPAHIGGDDFLRIRELRMQSESLGKKNDDAFQATYSERRHYESTAEDSHYWLVYRFKRV